MKAAVQYLKQPAAVFFSVTPTVQKETLLFYFFFPFVKCCDQKQEKEKTYMPYAYIRSTGLLKIERPM